MSALLFAVTSFITWLLLSITSFTVIDKKYSPKDKISTLVIKNTKLVFKMMVFIFLAVIIAACVFASVYFSLDYLSTK